ncbi:hypothetical protein CKK33_08015 [Mucilaginibacter sp. MD40]|uniref:hypothetical protein n=1 Tax=Mucilaginibacter sp. MD40 TaxID=2029590 RepID=UPI000BAC86C8|nr:hypothetical protein [Mucilaginibacter sp. MD40]PAW93439.1 hypothetical protein CKK33_08015 [Mucilaginibacter sp. MD40]
MTVVLNTHRKLWFTALMALIALLFTTSAFKADDTNEPNLHRIRKLLVTALESKKTTDSLYSHLSGIKDRSALLTAYMGTLEALKAKHAWNPYYKIKYLNDSEKTFKGAVSADPHNIEIRFMRFSIEHNVPKFLGINKNLIADREEMIKQIDRKYYSSADKALVKTIITFLLESKRCTPTENENLKEHLAAL